MLLPILMACTQTHQPRAVILGGYGQTVEEGAHLAQGGWRFRIEPEQIVWAEAPFAGAILGLTQTPDGWLFVDSLGGVAASSSFTGTPHRVGQLQDPIMTVSGHGRLALLDASGRWWSTAGGPPELLVVPGAGRVIGASFLQADRGAALTEGGYVWLTSDGGQSWTRSEVERGVELVQEFGRLGVRTDPYTEPRTLLEGPDLYVPLLELPPYERSLQARYAQDPLAELGRPADEGGVLRVRPGQPSLMLGLNEKQLQEIHPDGSFSVVGEIPSEGGCWRLYSWGDGLVASCLQGGGSRLYASRTGRVWTALGEAIPQRLRDGELSLGEDGLSAAVVGGCRGQTCVTTDGGASWRPLELDADRLGGLRHGQLLARAGEPRSWSVVDLASGEILPLEIPEMPAGARVSGVGWGDRHPWMTLAPPEGPPRWLASGPAKEMRLAELPEGTLGASMSVSGLAVAAGVDASKLWWSEDHGQRWLPLEVAVDGDPSALPLVKKGDDSALVSCSDTACAVGHFEATRALVGHEEGALAFGPSAPMLPKRPWQERSPAGLPELACTAGPAREPALPAAGEGVRRLLIGGTLEAAVDARPDGQVVVRWADDAGVHASAPSPLKPRLVEIIEPSLRAHTDRGLLVSEGGLGGSWWVTDGAPLARSSISTSFYGPSVSDPDGTLWLAQPDVTEVQIPIQISELRLLEQPTDGSRARESSRSHGHATSPFTPLVGWLDGLVLARPTGTELGAFEISSPDSPEVRLHELQGELSICSATGASQLWVQSDLAAVRAQLALPEGQGYVRLSLEGQRACVDGLLYVQDDPEHWSLSASARAGELSGRDAQGRAISCRLASEGAIR